MKPIIGIITRPDQLPSGNKVEVIYKNIRTAIIKNGGIPIGIIPTTENYDVLDQNAWNDLLPLLKKCHGFVFQGGDNFYNYDLKILDYAYQNDIPSLGICLGMQLMSIYKNGTLKTVENHYGKEPYVHNIIIKPNTKLSSLLQNQKVNSRHHEQVLKTDLQISAYSEDGVIEAVEDPDKKFFIGIQWHVEDMIAYDKVMNSLWNDFILTCRECINETN